MTKMMRTRTRSEEVVEHLRAYWDGLRKGRLVPSRTDIDPRGIETTLHYTYIIERIAPGMGRFRVAGMHLNDLMGMEVRGMPLSSMFEPAARKGLSDACEAVFNGPAIAEFDLRSDGGVGRPPLQAKLLILPLSSDLGDISRAMGCLVCEQAPEDLGRAPRRFVTDRVTLEELQPANPHTDHMAKTPDAPKAAPARPLRPEAPPLSPEARRALFRIVSKNE